MALEFSSIVQQIKQGGNTALASLYTSFRTEFIGWMQKRMGCDVELAKDIYQQSIIVLYENVQNGKLTDLTSSVKTYLFGIGRNKYLEVVRQQKRSKELMEVETSSNEPEYEALLQNVEACLQKLGEPCRSLLMQYYYHKRNVEELAAIFKYKNTDTAKNQKYKCLERLRRMVKEEGQFSMDN